MVTGSESRWFTLKAGSRARYATPGLDGQWLSLKDDGLILRMMDDLNVPVPFVGRAAGAVERSRENT